MSKYDNEMTFTVVSYDKQLGYHGCIDSNGKTHLIDLCVASVFDESDEWLLAKLLWVKLSRTIGLRIGLKKLNNVHPQFTN